MGNGPQQPLREQIIHIDADVLVIEGQMDGARVRKPPVPIRDGEPAVRRPIEEGRPALLQKGEERFPVRHDPVQWPTLEAPLDSANEALVQQGGDAPAGIVTAQQNVQQVGRRSHQIGDDAEDMPQREILGSGLA